jgi:hypothetical protein
MIQSALVADLYGLSGRVWAKRASGAELYRGGPVELYNRPARSLPLVMRSIAARPSPLFAYKRFKSLLIDWVRPQVAGGRLPPGTG